MIALVHESSAMWLSDRFERGDTMYRKGRRATVLWAGRRHMVIWRRWGKRWIY